MVLYPFDIFAEIKGAGHSRRAAPGPFWLCDGSRAADFFMGKAALLLITGWFSAGMAVIGWLLLHAPGF